MKYPIIEHTLKLLLCTVALGVVSCTTSDEIVIDQLDTSSGHKMELSAHITQHYVSRANDNGFADGDKIGVYIVNYKDGQPQQLALRGNYADNVQFVYSDADNKWTGAYQLYWQDDTTPVDAYGYYPFDNELSSVIAYPFTIERNQNALKANTNLTGYEVSDFLYAKSENIKPSSQILKLDHKHIMAGVQVTLVEGSGFAEGAWESLTKQVVIDNTKLSAQISLQTGTVTVDDNAPVQAIIPMGSNCEYRAIVVPQTVDAGKSLISITVGTRSYKFNREVAMTYNSGLLHRFTLEVTYSQDRGDYDFTLLDESILPWQNDPVTHNGSAREYITVHVNEGEYIGDVVSAMDIDPKEVKNLKLTGVFSKHDHFRYIRENFPYLEAVNMKELRTIDQQSFRWEGGWGDPPYNQPIRADDYIPEGAFARMRYLAYIVWPDHLVGIGNSAFTECNLRGGLVLPEGLKHIGGSAFENTNGSFTGELHLPSTLEFIGGSAFDSSGTSGLSGEFVLPPKVVHIGGDAFNSCKYLTGKIHIPETLDRLEHNALPANLSGDAIIPQNIKFVGGVTKKVTSVYFPEGVEEIGSGAFMGVESLKGDLSLPSTIKKIGEQAFAATGISHVKLPESIDVIEYNTFGWCTSLQDTLTIPSSVERIKGRAFADCHKLSAVILPENLMFIEDEAFANCRSLEYIRILAVDPPQLHGGAFNGVEKNNFTLVVPPEAVEAYKNADGWREFKRIAAYRNFVCRPMSAQLLNNGNTRTIVLNADSKWSVTDHPSWARPSMLSGEKKCELTVEIDRMPHGEDMRSGSIIFTLNDKTDEDGNPIICSYDITQYDYQYEENSELRLQTATKGNNGGINITFVGDGYCAKDIADGTYLSDVKEGVEYLFGLPPYDKYREYFNVNVDFALSYESGVCSNVNIWRETKFNSTYGAGVDGRLLVDPNGVSSYVLNDVDNSSITPENINQSVIVCILHSDVYEGVAQLYTNGAAVAFVPHSRYEIPNDYRGLIQHEVGGHCFGKLADEYVYHFDNIMSCTCGCCSHSSQILINQSLGWYRNISLSGKYSDIEWQHLIFHPDYDDIVDIYDGAYLHRRGVYRSEYNSCMNNNVPYYNTISRQAIVERIKEYAGEEFTFEQFVENDSREMGEYTRSATNLVEAGDLLHYSIPTVIEGSPLDYIKTK